jgi:hypothetical protein
MELADRTGEPGEDAPRAGLQGTLPAPAPGHPRTPARRKSDQLEGRHLRPSAACPAGLDEVHRKGSWWRNVPGSALQGDHFPQVVGLLRSFTW